MSAIFNKYLESINNCGPGDPLLSSTPLGKLLDGIALAEVNRRDLTELYQSLNVEQLVPTESGIWRDYRGLAELMGFSLAKVESSFRRSINPTQTLLDTYLDATSINKTVTVNDLLKKVEQIERFDVIDDFIPTLLKIIASNQANQQQQQHQYEYQTSVALLDCPKPVARTQVPQEGTGQLTADKFSQLTVDDRPNVATSYDAFICFAPQDRRYAQFLLTTLQAEGLRVVEAEDLLPGHFEHDALIRLIDERCRKVIIVLTPNFSMSKECEFQVKFASEIGIKANSLKLIPIVFEHCHDSQLPSMVKVLTKIDLTSSLGLEWKIRRLVRAIGAENRYSSNTDAQHSNDRGQPANLARLEQQQSLACLAHFPANASTENATTVEPIVELQHSASFQSRMSQDTTRGTLESTQIAVDCPRNDAHNPSDSQLRQPSTFGADKRSPMSRLKHLFNCKTNTSTSSRTRLISGADLGADFSRDKL